MKPEDCRDWDEELIEAARLGGGVSAALREHLDTCPECRERWAAEQALSGHLTKLRTGLAALRSPENRRRQLMQAVARQSEAPRRAWFGWAWATAAVSVLAVALLPVWRSVPITHPAVVETGTFAAFDEDGYAAVPFTPPLAPGESVHVVREELNEVELAAMGIVPPGGLSGAFDAEVMEGEDGLPRAIQLIEYVGF